VSRPAVFLDRDGVLIADVDLLHRASDIVVLDGVPGALSALADAGYALVVVTNQTVVARGLVTEDELAELHAFLRQRLRQAGGPELDAIYVCPHHPSATLPAYRTDCDCRKPRPGMLFSAERDLDLDLTMSTFVGDRPSDIVAGALAGCATVLVRSGAHASAPIETSLELEEEIVPDHICADLAEAAGWILSRR
jgi:D-glycero-D-manno-heptose 1,7-bisphosphate phosphatase